MRIVNQPATLGYGRLPERTKGTVSNTVDAATYPWVQIPYLPPKEIGSRLREARFLVLLRYEG